ncbi:MAG: response regulator transcription factor [Propionibacteriaceae bacterium]|jgi:DNA-binding response OmpR family regulator|nr:response regulator transcription factor [Propionibacteriaceae bacterium]
MAVMLIADDNQHIVSILEEYAKRDGYVVHTAFNGKDALRTTQTTAIDIVLLDVMMPGLDGFEVCRRIRADSTTPIIMITARGEDADRIMGLDIGADDYIVKPFSPGEVMARVRAVLRRIVTENGPTDKVFRFGDLSIDLNQSTTVIGPTSIPLTRRETELLWLLASHKNRVYPREVLLDILWGYDYDGDLRTVDTHIKRLRAKLDAVQHPGWAVTTVWGVGYKFEVKTS